MASNSVVSVSNCCAGLLVEFGHNLPTRAIKWHLFSMLIVREAIRFSGKPLRTMGQKSGKMHKSHIPQIAVLYNKTYYLCQIVTKHNKSNRLMLIVLHKGPSNQ
jgi:hypothetical protein